MSQNKENEGCCLLPDWAERESDGNYMEAGAQLATRDGRRCGNAYVDRVEAHDRLGQVAVVVTDMGSTFRMTARELEGAFHPPAYVMKLDEARKRSILKDHAEMMASLMEEAAKNLADLIGTPRAEELQVRHPLPDELDGCALMLRHACGIARPNLSGQN